MTDYLGHPRHIYATRIQCNCGYDGPGPHNCAGVWQDDPSYPSPNSSNRPHQDLHSIFLVLEQIRDELRRMNAVGEDTFVDTSNYDGTFDGGETP